MNKPVWLLDIDGVVNAISDKPDRSVWPGSNWKTGEVETGGEKWPILWCTAVVFFINDVHRSGSAEVRWHTTWQEDAQDFADLVGLDRFEVAEAPEFYEINGVSEAKRIAAGLPRPRWWKIGAAERVVQKEKRPLVWTDDDIYGSLIGYSIRNNLQRFAPVQTISPSETTGLTPKHLRIIDHFLSTV